MWKVAACLNTPCIVVLLIIIRFLNEGGMTFPDLGVGVLVMAYYR